MSLMRLYFIYPCFCFISNREFTNANAGICLFLNYFGPDLFVFHRGHLDLIILCFARPNGMLHHHRMRNIFSQLKEREIDARLLFVTLKWL